MKKFWIVFIIIAVLISAGLGTMWRLVNRMDAGGPRGGGILHWRVDRDYAEERDDSMLGQILAGRPLIMRDIVFGLERAARDHRIEGLLLDIHSLPTDWAKVEELREAVAGFAASGKPVVAYLEGGGMQEYALALAAGQVALAPEANLMILGVSAEMVFLKQTLDKLGMQADYVHVGRYKSAPEMYTRDRASAANREMIEAIVENRYARIVAMVSQGRGFDAAGARQRIDAGIYDADSARAAGLVDTVLCREETLEWRFGSEDLLPLSSYVASRPRGRVAAKVALVYVTGTIMPGDSRSDHWRGKTAGSETVVDQLRAARKDDAIDAVLLRVDSPGGSALASDLIWHEIAKLRLKKPVVVSMSGYAASGGYYVSCGADSIFAWPGTLTGSIGVFAGKMDMNGFYAKLGVRREYVTRGENALIFSDDATFTAVQRTRLQSLLNDFYDRFVAKVGQGRGLGAPEMAEIAEGRVWTGEQALANGLVDGLGGLHRSLKAIKYRLGLDPADRVAVISYEKRPSLLERLLVRSLRERVDIQGQLPAFGATGWLAAEGFLAAGELLDGEPLALLPFRLEFR
jgi:protease-4